MTKKSTTKTTKAKSENQDQQAEVSSSLNESSKVEAGPAKEEKAAESAKPQSFEEHAKLIAQKHLGLKYSDKFFENEIKRSGWYIVQKDIFETKGQGSPLAVLKTKIEALPVG